MIQDDELTHIGGCSSSRSSAAASRLVRLRTPILPNSRLTLDLTFFSPVSGTPFKSRMRVHTEQSHAS